MATRSRARLRWQDLSNEEIDPFFTGYGHQPVFVEGEDPGTMYQLMAAALDKAIAEIQTMQSQARKKGLDGAPSLANDHFANAQGLDRSESCGRTAEGSCRSHQVPLRNVKSSLGAPDSATLCARRRHAGDS